MKNIYILGLVIVFVFAVSIVPAQAAKKDLNTIDNAPEEKERGITSPERLRMLEEVLRDTPNGDKVMRILKRKLPGIVD